MLDRRSCSMISLRRFCDRRNRVEPYEGIVRDDGGAFLGRPFFMQNLLDCAVPRRNGACAPARSVTRASSNPSYCVFFRSLYPWTPIWLAR